ncbi:MAG: carboxypeptidase-like regulatory domain-containing protein [Pseudarcicella sp.]|nr:carboxypeptidase-like regulatory domain-containing protein [Pseudarcicella sp.]MBP6410599.1 carboxypeptidase-like regulatory domain-containing protein [Pseudarcicella sp.]
MKNIFFWGFFLVLINISTNLYSQKYTITGHITDASNGDPVPFASVSLKGINKGAVSTFEGNFKFSTDILTDSLFVSSMGYAIKYKALDKTALNQHLEIIIAPATNNIMEVVIRSGENPAFKILRGMQRNKKKNDRKQLSAFEYDAYTKIELDVDNIQEKMKKRKVMQQIQGAIDSFEKIKGEDGKAIIPVFISESASKFYYNESPQRKKEIIQKNSIKGVGVRKDGIVSQLIGGNLLANYNFYDNYVPFLGKDFASPVGENWKTNYKYYLADTIELDEHPCYIVEFDPKNPKDLVFTGKMYVDTATFALVQIDATIGSDANLNYIDKIKIQQTLEKTTEGAWLPAKTRFLIDIKELTQKSAGMLAKIYISNSNFVINQPKPLSFYDQSVETLEGANEPAGAEFWAKTRAEAWSAQDILASKLIDTIKNVPIVRTYIDIAEIVTSGYKRFSKFDIGPYISTFAYNNYEGLRIRLGARTNAGFSKHLTLKGYLGYGTKDNDWKYNAQADYLFSKKHYTIAGIRYTKELERMGLTPELIGENKLFYAFTRWGNKFAGAFDRRETEVYLKTEPSKSLIVKATLTTSDFDPRFPFQYRTDPDKGMASPLANSFTNSFVTLDLRYAQNENFIMDGNERISLGTKRIPVISFQYQHGLKGFMGGAFSYHKFSGKIHQSFRVGTLGRSEYTLSGGYIPSKLPAPLLFPHVGNEVPLYNKVAFNTMRFFEFVSDKYVSLNYNHNFEGIFFNRIPLIKKLKWRFVATSNLLFGKQRQENKDIMQAIERDANGEFVNDYFRKPKFLKSKGYIFQSLNPVIPYAEVGYGIDNIFKIFRIQALHRLSYLDHLGNNEKKPSRFFVKASVHFSF